MSAVVRRGRKAAVVATNVVPIRQPAQPVEDILAAVHSKREHQDQYITSMLEDLNAEMDRRRESDLQHRLLPIGRALQGPDFADWLEIGQRMLARRKR